MSVVFLIFRFTRKVEGGLAGEGVRGRKFDGFDGLGGLGATWGSSQR